MTTNELDRATTGPHTARPGWFALAADVLGCPVEVIRLRADTATFIDLGGTSLRAAEFVARVERELGIAPRLPALLDQVPLTTAMADAADYRPLALPAPGASMDRPALPSQEGMLGVESVLGGTGMHLLFTAESATPFEPARLRAALAGLTQSHESLRTVFVRTGTGFARRVLPNWQPRLIEQRLTPPHGADPVTIVHTQLGAASSALLAPFDEPPVLFVHSSVEDGPDLLSMLVHHTLVDGWALARFWHEFARAYVRGVAQPGPPPELIATRYHELAASGRLAELTRIATHDLAGLPEPVDQPVDRPRPPTLDVTGMRLPFGLSTALRDKVNATARQLGVTHTVVVFTAWALAVGRRAGIRDFAVGVAMSGRPVAELHDVIAPCVAIVPVRCQLDDTRTVAEQLRACADGWVAAAERADLPLEHIIAALDAPDPGNRMPLLQTAFGAHDELLGGHVRDGELDLVLHEGHCGAAVMDTTLFLASWTEHPVLRLEYQPAALSPAEALDLVEGFTAALAELAGDVTAPLSSVRTISAAQHRWLAEHGEGPATDCEAGLWQLFEQTAARYPDAIAVEELSYAQLLAAVRTHAAALADVRPGDRVVLALPRGVAEIVAVLAVLHRGAAYVAIDTAAPRAWLAEILDQVAPRAVIGSADLAELASCRAVPAWTPADPHVPGPPPAPADPARTAYLAFTSGSTGRPKGVPVPHRAVVRLVRDVGYVRLGPGERYLRLAPLAFDASTLELFAPLLSGAGIAVFPEGPVAPTELARFLLDRQVSVLWLTAGLFRLVVDTRPEAFARVRQVLTGGDVVPAAQVRQLLSRYPGLRVTNGYGPTECTTFVAVHHVDSIAEVSDPLPIGRPVPGTRVFLLDEHGEPVPPGAIGELCVSGAGLADGYLGAPEETARAYGWQAPTTGERLYRTGDLARWDGRGRLCLLGRLDQQLKVRGFRVEPDAVARRLREHPAVRDAVVAGTGTGTDRRLLAAVIVTGQAPTTAQLRAWVGAALPSWAVPELWSFTDAFPLTANAKVDLPALAARATA